MMTVILLNIYWITTVCHTFLPFHTVHGLLRTRMLKWFAIPFSSGPCIARALHHDLPVLGGPIQHGSWFNKVTQAVVHEIILVIFVIVVFILFSLWWMRVRGLCKHPDWRDWLWGKLGLALVGRAMLSKSLIQMSVDAWAVLPPC